MMKRLLSTILLAVFATFFSFAGPQEDILAAMKSGDASKLSEYFDNNVDLKILEKENIFSKSQAKVIMKEFFTNNHVTNMVVNHEGGPENARFAICNLTTTNGAFRVYYLLKNKDGKLLIQKFRIEKDGQ